MQSENEHSNLGLFHSKNMTTMKLMNDQLEKEVKEECSKFGDVMNVIVFVVRNLHTLKFQLIIQSKIKLLNIQKIPGKPKNEQVRIFVEYTDLESAYLARKALKNITYDDRELQVNFYDSEEYYAYKFDAEI
jgi:hypothetical protein